MEFVASNNSIHETLNKDSCRGWYRVGRVEDDKRKCNMVQYPSYYGGIYIRCNSAIFETLGALCQHALYILKKNKVMELSKQYILVDRPYLSGK